MDEWQRQIVNRLREHLSGPLPHDLRAEVEAIEREMTERHRREIDEMEREHRLAHVG